MKYDKILYGKDEFYPNLNNKIYQILTIDNKTKEEYMTQIFDEFIQNQNTNINEKHYIGIDFEFNKISKGDRNVALMQINLENDSDIGHIFILLPPELSSVNILIKLLTHTNIIKILHGSESLDIPYLFNQLLITEENVNNFCSNFYDTKYLCDYKKETKCSIYDLLLYNKIMTEKKFKELDKIEDELGPIYLIYIDIYKLSHNLLKYALYDVIFLPELLKKYIFNPDDIEICKIISEISCIINKYKRGFLTTFNNLELFVNKMNNYYFYYNNNRILLIDIWHYYNNIVQDKNKYINKLYEINYFKHFLTTITKFIIYNNINKEFIVYKNKQEKLNKILLSLNFLDSLTINKIFNEYNNIINTDVKIIKNLYIK
jgi:hypothetical protein